jgi:Transposase DDE domain
VRRNPKPQRRYRLRNWREYTTARRTRGSLTLWCDEAAVAGWVARERTGRRGRSPTYSDLAITCMLTLQAVYHLSLSATVGLMRSLLTLVGGAAAELPVAHESTLSRRRRTLAVALLAPERARPAEPLHLVVDTTGLKVYGEGEWKVRQHGWTRRRTWVKVHLGVDAATQEVRVVDVTASPAPDGRHLPALLAQEPAPLAQLTGDGAYEGRACYAAVAARPEHPRAVFPPRRERRPGRRPRPTKSRPRPTAWRRDRGYALHVWQHGNCKAPPLDRDQHGRRIRRVGRRRWKREVGYHRRSLAETAISRDKRLFGPGLAVRDPAGQRTTVRLRYAALNRMSGLGMPDSYRVDVAA